MPRLSKEMPWLTPEEAGGAPDAGSTETLQSCISSVKYAAADARVPMTALQLLQKAAGNSIPEIGSGEMGSKQVEEANAKAMAEAIAKLTAVAAKADEALLSLLCRQIFQQAIAECA